MNAAAFQRIKFVNFFRLDIRHQKTNDFACFVVQNINNPSRNFELLVVFILRHPTQFFRLFVINGSVIDFRHQRQIVRTEKNRAFATAPDLLIQRVRISLTVVKCGHNFLFNRERREKMRKDFSGFSRLSRFILRALMPK